MKSVAGAGARSSWMPWVTDTAAPATNRPSAASSDQTYASRPCPSGCARSRGRRERRWATSSKTWLPVSAQECAASASSEADPVTTAATDFAIATRRLAAKAIRTVVTLADAVASDGSACGPRSCFETVAVARSARPTGHHRDRASADRRWPGNHPARNRLASAFAGDPPRSGRRRPCHEVREAPRSQDRATGGACHCARESRFRSPRAAIRPRATRCCGSSAERRSSRRCRDDGRLDALPR